MEQSKNQISFLALPTNFLASLAAYVSRYFEPEIEDLNTGGIYSERYFLDRRCTRNPTQRRKITRTKNSQKTINGRHGQGRHYAEVIEDPEEPGHFYPRREYRNYAIRSCLRKYDGFNVHPRHRQQNQYRHGYKINGEMDVFMDTDDEYLDSELSDSEEYEQLQTDE